MHADWPAIQGIGKAKNCTQADTHTRQVRPPREHAGPWPERACLTRPNSPGSRDPTPTGSHLGNHARTPGETHLLSCAAAHDQHDGEAELKRILRDLGPHRGEALRDRARLPNRHPGSSVRVSRDSFRLIEFVGLVRSSELDRTDVVVHPRKFVGPCNGTEFDPGHEICTGWH